MKITKKQLRRIIQEEKNNLMSENNPRPSFMQRDTDYAIGTYADVSKIKILDSAVEDLYHGILAEAVEDGREPDEAKSLAGRAVISLVSKKLDNLINPRPRG